ncbi:unnamed protein product [Brachionus calyciflorus]|uniref:Uncharacterized protein n=1 Tax=Brachionus calyciflorus TaxID=104777 RepID=A0A813QCP8_9BILA|nr:unnamed protein product [Brachionus calyciflorus]
MLVFFILNLGLYLANGFDLMNSKYWLTSCSLTGCSITLNACLNCFGERGCTSCVTSIRPECDQCISDIYNKNDLETYEGVQYFICDSLDSFQEKICHIYCRGQYKQTGKCTRYQNLPICQCTNDNNQLFSNSTINPVDHTTLETSTTTTTSLTTRTTAKPIYNVQGSLKLKVSYMGFSKFFALPNGDLISFREHLGTKFEIWDSQKGIIKRSFDPIYNSSRNIFGILSNGDLIVDYSEQKAFIIWDLNTYTEKYRIQTTEFISCLHVLKNDDLVIGQYTPNSWTNKNFDLVIRDSQNGSIKKRLIGHTLNVYEIISLPNGYLASCSDDSTVRIWDHSKGILIKTVTIYYRAIRSIAYLENINHMALGLTNGTIALLNVNNYSITRSLYGHLEQVCWYTCLHALDNGDLLSTGDSSIKIWNTKDGSLKSTLRSHQYSVGLLTFLPNGNLVSVSMAELAIWS